MFHAVCGALVEPFGLDSDTEGFTTVFKAVYRQVDHGRMEKNSRDAAHRSSAFSDPLKSFAKQISGHKNKREQADYDPLAKINVSTISSDLQTVETILDQFWQADARERARFAVFLAMRR
ncbi:hypothetical protein HKCCE4037_04280 [Rhodobacterales bacterium HKCCE4037]|nr:hypothetical protein [Rhodobacterales bacterium HKCCE4037]